MFRTAMTLTLLALLSSPVSATDPCSRPCAGQTLHDTPEHAAQQDAYLQSRLDWRSYYLNRLVGRQSDASPGAAGWPTPSGPQRP
jgi:hypothetical protein